MLIAHLGHGEVYVPTIEKTFFEHTLERKKISCFSARIFILRTR